MIAGNQLTEVIRHHWNSRAGTFEQHGPHNAITSDEQHNAWLEQLSRWTGSGAARVLDVGCGTGVLSLLLAELGHQVTGVDFAPKMIDLARQKARVRGFDINFRVEDAANLSDAAQAYDIVIARHVIWTLPDPVRALREWMRVLRPNGQLVLIESTFANNEPGAPAREARPLRKFAESLSDAVLRVASFIVGRTHWRLYAKQYRIIQAQLPFSGGAPADRLVQSMHEQGLRDTRVEPLMRRELWGEIPPYPRYAVLGVVPPIIPSS